MNTPSSPAKVPACAACRHHRKRCAPDCPLAPFFPAHRQKEFRNAHKLFGVSNILKLIEKLTPPQKKEAIKSIIYEANARAADPVRGCVGWIPTLLQNIKQVETELGFVTLQLDFYRKHSWVMEMGMMSSSADLHNYIQPTPAVELESEDSSSSLLIHPGANVPHQIPPTINDQQPGMIGNVNFGAGFDDGSGIIMDPDSERMAMQKRKKRLLQSAEVNCQNQPRNSWTITQTTASELPPEKQSTKMMCSCFPKTSGPKC